MNHQQDPRPNTAHAATNDIPRGDAANARRYFKNDVAAGFLVFLIALPLCLGIAIASGFPAIAGIFSAAIGAILATCLSNSELTIKGPAAGMIVIVLGCIEYFGGDGAAGGFTDADTNAYRLALGIGVAAAILQIVAAKFKAGVLGDFFPRSAIHGMLSAIGLIIIAKQVPVALGVSAGGSPLQMLADIPSYLVNLNPYIALIGVVSLVTLFAWPHITRRVTALRFLPGQLVVLFIAIPMSLLGGLGTAHEYTFAGAAHAIGPQHLVAAPDRIFGLFDEITLPDFSGLAQLGAWKWVALFAIVGSIESILSAKAVDVLDPYRRKSDMNRDLLAVGAANLAASAVGGLPVISEIVRSKASIDSGAKTRFANFWHGAFLISAVALLPAVLNMIPLAALAAMLVYTGFRLAHPREFTHAFKVGRDQLIVFVTTLLGTLIIDILAGIALGIAAKITIHLINGAPIASIFKPQIDLVSESADRCELRVRGAAIFTGWLLTLAKIRALGLQRRRSVILDLSSVRLVDHTTMASINELERDFIDAGLTLYVVGLEHQHGVSNHPFAARKSDDPITTRRAA